MLDFDLQMRFFKSASDAFVEFTSAAFASAAHIQDQITHSVSQPGQSSYDSGFNAFSPLSWWSAAIAQPSQSAFFSATPNFGPAFFQVPSAMMSPMAPLAQFWSAFLPAPAPLTPAFGTQAFGLGGNGIDFGLNDMMRAWGAPAVSWTQPFSWTPPFSWTMYQWPWTMMLISAGMPHAIASPTARGSAASLDAADAAREQMSRLFSAYRSDGGHASAQIVQSPAALMVTTMPWMQPFLTPFLD